MTNPEPGLQTATDARLWVARALIQPASRFPDLEPARDEPTGLSPADAALATAIYRTTVQRWLTLEYLLDQFLSQRLRKLEPGMQAVLLSASAQLVFLDRLPDYAVVDQAVGLARKLVRPGAAGMANAVLRKVARLAKAHEPDRPWVPGRKSLPLGGGGTLVLRQNILPDPADAVATLVAATSMPRVLVKHWIETYGMEAATRLCLHAIENPPTVVAVEPGFEEGGEDPDWVPHRSGGSIVWRGKREPLAQFLAGHPARRVQDTASSASCLPTRSLAPRSILDYCAGRGTKTRQLAAMHPDATVTATDTSVPRREQLREATEGLANVQVVEPGDAGNTQYDLVVLDVPCSNTGVLARRPEARYRYSQHTLGELIGVQRRIVEQARAWVRPGGHLLYCTCSIERAENRKQVDRLLRATQGEIVAEGGLLPGGTGDSYTDGSYHALVRL